MSGRQVIGVDAGGTKLLAGVVDERLAVTHRVHRVWSAASRDRVVETIAAAVEQALALAPAVGAVGCGVPSLVDEASGTSISSVHLPLDDVPLRDLLRTRLGLPVRVENDATAAVVAEQRLGAARGASDVVLLTLGTGIGGGLVLGGRVQRGCSGAGAELGHMTVDLDGPECFGDCPGRGCLEAVASGSAIARDGLEAARATPASALGAALAADEPITGLLVSDAARGGDAVARAVVERVGQRLGAGIAGLVNALNPELVVVGGGVMALGELLLEPAREEVRRRALRPARDQVRIVPAALGEDAGMLGAALLALEQAAVPEGAR